MLRSFRRPQANQLEQRIEALPVTRMKVDPADLLRSRDSSSLSRSRSGFSSIRRAVFSSERVAAVSSCRRIRLAFATRSASTTLFTSSRISPGKDHIPHAELGDLDTTVRDTRANIVPKLRVERSLRRQHLIQRAAGDRLSDRELHQTVQPRIHVRLPGDDPLGVDHPAKRRQGHPQRDAILGQHLLRGDLDRLRTQVEPLDLDLAAGDPEGRSTRAYWATANSRSGSMSSERPRRRCSHEQHRRVSRPRTSA